MSIYCMSVVDVSLGEKEAQRREQLSSGRLTWV